MRAKDLLALSALVVLSACAGAQEPPGPGIAPAGATSDAAAEETSNTAAAEYARLDPRLRPDWTSRAFFPPEYCWHVVSMDRAHPLYWDIRKFCRKKRGRRTRR